ncbi:hypothetical protein K8Q94_03280 [Candidatus Nomurabacteria bacterium]|nr:hypothetical protein [Candidatus Nomurabacteria bacterium]
MVNLSEKKFSLSKPQSAMFIELEKPFFDGETGDLVAKAKVEKYIGNEVRNNPDFLPKEVSFDEVPSLTGILDDAEREKFGKTIQEMEFSEVLEKYPNLVQEFIAAQFS